MSEAEARVLAVLRALLMGLPIKVGLQTFQMDAAYRLCVQARNIDTDEVVLLPVNFGGLTLDQFITWAKEISEVDAVNINLNVVLKEGMRRE